MTRPTADSQADICTMLLLPHARASRVDVMLTFNERHFATFAGTDLAVVTPA